MVPQLVGQATAADSISVADLTPRRDWLWVEDFAEALLCIVKGSPDPFQIFNVGYGASTSVGEVLDLIQEIVGKRQIVCRYETRRNEIPDCVCDHSAMTDRYGWHPVTDLRTGLDRLIATHRVC